ncbi:MAG: hypothetical protein IKU88_07725 [Alistipes sp.]|nr:hypothetical protein [Alistipes sp.]
MRPIKWHNTGRRVRLVATLLVAMLCIASCSNERNIVVMADVDIANWSEPKSVTLKNDIGKCTGELTIVMHVNRYFKAKEVELEIVSRTADSLRLSEKISSRPTIEWPAPSAHSVDVEIPYRHNVEMRREGPYTYTITPLKPLQGVESVGISFRTKTN